MQKHFPKAEFIGDNPELQHLVRSVVAQIEQPQMGQNLPLDIRGTAFQEKVWAELSNIPKGCTASYGDIAQAIGKPESARAVAQACAANPIAVLVPCHRVVRSDGTLSGYRWGVERKAELLDREADK